MSNWRALSGAGAGQTSRRGISLRRITPSLLALLAGLAASPALAAGPVLPSGGSVVAGSAAIGTPSGGALSISQTSSRAIIDWSGFSIGAGGTVRFDNGTGATLNRVTGGSVSSIDGLLSASGSVYLINPNGVIVGKDGVVNVGGTFVASTLDVGNSGFMAGGDLTFTGASTASVINLGRVGSLGGDVALIGATVQNSGSISAPNGDVGLIAGQSVLMRDGALNDGRFTVLVGGPATFATNSGSITAAEAELRSAGGNVYALAGNTTGVIRATGIATGGGKVFLIAEGGTTTAQGEIDATNADGSGGHVETSGAAVEFSDLIVKAGDWLIDPTDLTVDAAAAATISTNLATTSVTLQTTISGASGPGIVNASGLGDINITSPISWSSGQTLTLDAFHSVNITAPVTVSGAGQVVIKTNDGGSGGGDTFGLGPSGFAGSLSFTGAPGGGQGLTINGQGYTLLYKLADGSDTGPDSGTDDIAGIDHAGDGGHYALAVNVDGTGTTFTGALAGAGSNTFTGAFDGLGHTIGSFTINPASFGNIALFGATSGLVSNLGLVGGNVSGGDMLAAVNSGAITDTFATGTVSGYANIGDLVGVNSANGVILHSYATGAVLNGYAELGGLVGSNTGAITDSYATGSVSGGSDVGGLVGINNGAITGSHASGAVNGGGPGQGSDAGGLVGANGGSIFESYATGAVSGWEMIGGLVGMNGGPVTQSYATGAVSGSFYVGGLVGDNSGPISQSYAGGTILSPSGYSVGGLVGVNNGTVSQSYAYGRVVATGNYIGGLVGQSNGSATNSFWDIGTSGITTSAGGTGLTTSALQSVLPTGFNSSVWGTGPSLYPYLKAFYASTPEAVSGFVYGASGTTPSVGTQVSVIANGAAFGSAQTGANGYYYVLAPGGTVTTGQSLLAYTTDGAGLATATSAPGQSGLNLNAQYLTVTTAATILSSAPGFTQTQAAALAADGGNLSAAAVINGATGLGLTATGSNFTIDQAFNSPTGLLVRTTASGAPITVAQPVNLTGSAGLELLAAGSIDINAPITVAGTGQVVLANTLNSSVGGYGFGLSSSGFAGSLSFTGTPGGGQGLTINGQAYTLLYKLADGSDTGPDSGTDDIAGIDQAGDGGHYALANNLDGTGVTFTGALAGAGANTFTGALEGLGHTITNLTINQPSGSDVGLFGSTIGTVNDLGLVGGGITGGGNNVGALAGVSNGAITNSYSSAAVSDVSAGLVQAIGGLVGANSGTISQSYSTGSVSGPNPSAGVNSSYVGGLAGSSNGLITLSYATGTVSGSQFVGGLVGASYAPITQSYATGAVTGNSMAGPTANEGDSSIGGLVGLNRGGITQSYATGVVAGFQTVGGLVGDSEAAITNSYASGSVTSLATSAFDGDGSNFGGLAGVSGNGAITLSHATGNVVAGGSFANDIGGLVGKVQAINGQPSITQSYATGSVSGADEVGGLVGEGANGLISLSHATGNVVGSEFVGGLVGDSLLSITQSYASGMVNGADEVGGLVGVGWGVITASYATGSVTASGVNAGGLAGGNAGTITTSYATGAVHGVSNVGGLVGFVYDTGNGENTIGQSYATGSVTGSTNVGGLVGENGGVITSSYWDTVTSGQSTSAGGVGLTTSQFSVASNFVGFTFGTVGGGSGWVIVDANGTLNNAGGAAGATRPMLLSEYSTTLINAHQVQLMALNLSANYTLGADIDMTAANGSNAAGLWTSAGFTPIGATAAFTGSLDGAGHTISNLTIDRPTTSDVGLFGMIGAGGVVKNLTLSGGSVIGLNGVGDLAGVSDGAITGVSASGSVTGTGMVGGLIGWNDKAGVVTSASDAGAAVTAGADGGGLVGYNLGHVSASAAGDDVVGTGLAYALGTGVGLNGAIGIVSGLTASGTVTIGATSTNPLIGVDLSLTLSALPSDPWASSPPPPVASPAPRTPPPPTSAPAGAPLPPDKPLAPAAIVATTPTPAAPADQLAKNLTPRPLTLALTSRMFRPSTNGHPGATGRAAPQVRCSPSATGEACAKRPTTS